MLDSTYTALEKMGAPNLEIVVSESGWPFPGGDGALDSGSGNHKSIRWLQWEKLIIIKEFGVLKFKYIHEFNVAMFGKQWWILVFSPYELISHVLKVRYYPNEGFLEAQNVCRNDHANIKLPSKNIITGCADDLNWNSKANHDGDFRSKIV
ncbi:hypothetical protein JHK84_045236 [Glycine max]|nr:hypothetical protein JHK86_045179 [Glycine max]KAG5108329.1 hypothetical protein JHK84_045236 [Glycine max]